MKKFLCIFLVITIILSFCACDNKNITPTNDNSSTNETSNPKVDDSNENIVSSIKTGKLFSTPYTVEDYVENAIIVSKNNQLLYGVLDNNGNEIIPIKYDYIEFINKENYVNGIDDELYFLTSYENVNTVININAEEVLSTSRSLWVPAIITTDIKNKMHTDTSPYFIERLNHSYALYTENGDFLYEITVPGLLNADDKTWLSDSVFCYYSKAPYDEANITTYNSNMEQIDSIKGAVEKIFSTANNTFAFVYDRKIFSSYKYNLEGMKLISIDANGIITTEKEFATLEEYNQELEKMEYEYGNKKYNLYTSNGTWKLEDANGTTIYDERYYNAFTVGGKNKCYALMNEDNQLMIIDRKGKKIVDYGVLETNDNNTLKMLCFDSSKQIVGIYEGKESILISVISSSDYFDIYCYSAE